MGIKVLIGGVGDGVTFNLRLSKLSGMTCPQCHVVSSRFSDVCVECGVQLRPATSQEAVQLHLPFAPVPPEIPISPLTAASDSVWEPSAENQPSPLNVRLPHPRFRWSVPALLLVLGASALVGRIVRSLSSAPRTAVAPVAPIPQANAESVRTADIAENAAIAAQSSYDSKPPMFSDIKVDGLERATMLDVPFPDYAPSSHKLRLQSSRPIFEPQRTQLSESYRRWQWRQGEDASQVDRVIDLYAPEAQIFFTPRKQISRDELRRLFTDMRLAGYFTSVSDQSPPRWAQNANGDEVEVLAFHLYMDDGYNRLWGQRHLVWQKQGNRWLIIRDDFPPCYFRKKEHKR